jgi:hypothetical protein
MAIARSRENNRWSVAAVRLWHARSIARGGRRQAAVDCRPLPRYDSSTVTAHWNDGETAANLIRRRRSLHRKPCIAWDNEDPYAGKLFGID